MNTRAINCPRCQRYIRWIQDSTYGGDVTFYHRCLEIYALVRPDGTVATNNPDEVRAYGGTRVGSMAARPLYTPRTVWDQFEELVLGKAEIVNRGR